MSAEGALAGRTAVITGGSGVLGTAMTAALAGAGATVVAVGRDRARLDAAVAAAPGSAVHGVTADVTDPASLAEMREQVLERVGPPDILVNGAGGNVPGATLEEGGDVFSLSVDALRAAIELNYFGALSPIQAFGPDLIERPSASIINVSSMTADRAVSRVVGYAGAKAALENLTRWLAVELARRSSGALRVNAIAPGFLVADQNRRLLVEESGELTARGRRIIDHTPVGRFGEPDDLVGTLLWLCGEGSRFVTGTVVPVDGGFSAYSGV